MPSVVNSRKKAVAKTTVFTDTCRQLERDGWQLVDYLPAAQQAVYTKNGVQKQVRGGGK